MLRVTYQVVVPRVCDYLSFNQPLYCFENYICETNYWSVVSRFLSVSFLVNCSDIGRLPICRDYSCFCRFLKTWLRGSQSISSRVRRTLGDSRSGLVDLNTLRWFRFSCTSSRLKLYVSSVLPAYLGCCGMLFSCSWVNTELKYVLRMLSMSLSVMTIWPVGILSSPTLSAIILFSLMQE